MEFFLNRRVVWKFVGWKLIILRAFFVKLQFMNSATILRPDKIVG